MLLCQSFPHSVLGKPQVLAEKAIAQPRDGGLLRFTCGLDGQVALGIEPHGSITKVGGSDAEQTVVNHKNLGMHDDRLVLVI
jgi:hypothetical protein